MKTLVKRKNGTYQAKIRITPNSRIIYRSLGTKNLRVASKRLDDLCNQLELESAGLVIPEKIAEARNATISRYLIMFLADLEKEVCDEWHTRTTQRLNKLARECRWRTLGEIRPLDFTTWRSKQKLTPGTLNDYLGSLNRWMDWLVDNELLSENPLRKIRPLSGKNHDPIFTRRSASLEQIRKLLDLAPEERKLAYLMALTTGLRRSELAAVEYGDMYLSAKHPYLIARASTTKNRKSDQTYLAQEIVNLLKNKNEAPERKVFEHPSMDGCLQIGS